MYIDLIGANRGVYDCPHCLETSYLALCLVEVSPAMDHSSLVLLLRLDIVLADN